MKATQKQYEFCKELSESLGKLSVYEYAKCKGIDEWDFCGSCLTETPMTEGKESPVCLLCGQRYFVAKMTPGPWLISPIHEKDHNALVVISQKEHQHIAVVTRYDSDCDDGTLPGEDYANARLIVAAPELLEACKAYVTIYGHRQDHQGGHAMKLAIAAVTKATGEQA